MLAGTFTVLGVLPLTVATGAGAEMRQSLGVAVFYGMLGVTVFGLLFTPVFYVVARKLARRRGERAHPARAGELRDPRRAVHAVRARVGRPDGKPVAVHEDRAHVERRPVGHDHRRVRRRQRQPDDPVHRARPPAHRLDGERDRAVAVVGRDDLVARGPIDHREHAGDAVAGARGEGDLGRRSDEQPAPGLAAGGGGVEERVDVLEQLAVGDLAAVVAPEHLGRVQPRAVGRQAKQHEAAGGAAQHGLDLVVLVGAGVVPGDVDGPPGMPGQKLLQELSHLAPALVPARDDDGLAAVPVDRAQAVAPGRLSGGGDHHLPPDGAPHRPDRRVPADVELVGVVEDLAWPYAAAGVLDRLFLSA